MKLMEERTSEIQTARFFIAGVVDQDYE